MPNFMNQFLEKKLQINTKVTTTTRRENRGFRNRSTETRILLIETSRQENVVFVVSSWFNTNEFEGCQTDGNSKPARRGRSSKVLASSSSLKRSAAGSQWTLRPSSRVMFTRWQTLIERWPISTS